MPQFRRLPPDIRMRPDVSDAWHLDHSARLEDHASRLTKLETEAAKPQPTAPPISPPSTAAPSGLSLTNNMLPVGYIRPALLLLTIGVVTGKITVEQAMSILRFVFGLPG